MTATTLNHIYREFLNYRVHKQNKTETELLDSSVT